jgi:PAS domain S-box-containing protein
MRRSKDRDLIATRSKAKNANKRHQPRRHSEHSENVIADRNEALRKSEEKLRGILAASPDAIVVTDLNGRIIDCNQAALKMYETRSRRDLIARSAFELIAKKDRQNAIENLERTLKQGSIKNLQYTLLTKNGVEYPAELSVGVVKDASNNPKSFVGILKDITERRQAEEALSESERRYRSVIDNIGIGVAIISPDMKILTLNNQMKKWFPSIDASKQPTCFKVFNNPPRGNVCSYCPTCKTLKDGSVHESTTYTPSGNEIRNYWIISSPLRDKDGKTVAAIEMVEDVTERKQMEKEVKRYSQRLERLVEKRTANLRESEEHFRSVADYASEAIVTTDARGRIVFWNKAAKRFFGYSPNEALGKSIEIMIPKHSRKSYQEAMHRLILVEKSNHTGKTHEFVGLRKNGSEFPLEVSFSVWKTKKSTFFTCIMRDITERKKVQKALHESEKRYRNLIETAPEAIYTLSEEGIITSLNPTFENITGWRRSEWLGKSFTAIIHPDDLPLAWETFQNTLNGKTPPSYELRVLSKSGKYLVGEFTSKPYRENGKIVGEFGIVRDITERKKAEKALRSSETKFRDLFENVPVGIYQSSPKGKIITANPKIVHMLGYDSLAELLAVDIARDLYVSAEDRQVWRKELEERGELRNAELILQRKDGKRLIALENAHVVLDDQRKVSYYEGTLVDITEIKMLEERLSALNYYSGKLNVTSNLQQIYELTLDAMEKMLGFENAAFMVVEKGTLRGVCQRGYPEPWLDLPLDGTQRGLTVKAVKTREVVLVQDVRKDRDYAEANPKVRSEVVVPVEIEDKVLGVLDIESQKVGAFSEKDVMLLQILASHVATAISNLEKRKEIEKRSNELALLMKSSAEMIRSTDLHHRLQKIAESIREHGWRRVVIRAVSEGGLETLSPNDMVTAGLTDEEKAYLWNNRVPGQVWRERIGPEFKRFRIGEFYYLPWSDPWVRKRFSQGTVSSHLKAEEMVDWNPDDLLYVPLRLADGRVVGMMSIDDPTDGRRPTKESLTSLELFIHQAAVAIENAQLFQQLNKAKNEIKKYADQLELKVKQRTQELVEAQSKLLKTERLAAIGEVAAMVGHDLRNPLTGIAGATYYLKMKSGIKRDNKLREMLEIIEKDVEYSNKIVNDLLDYSREIHLELKETTPKAIVREAMSLAKIPHNVQLSDSTRNKPRIRVDMEKMKRVCVNLIKNAVDAMPKGGKLTIKSNTMDDQLEMVFIDTGIGITKEVLQKLWSPLFTTKAKGMGFGLPICKRVVEAHGGNISVESTVGKGTTFTVTIPIEPKLEGGGNVWVNVPESLLSMMMKA